MALRIIRRRPLQCLIVIMFPFCISKCFMYIMFHKAFNFNQNISNIKLFNYLGRLVKVQNKRSNKFSLEGLSKGVYFIDVGSDIKNIPVCYVAFFKLLHISYKIPLLQVDVINGFIDL